MMNTKMVLIMLLVLSVGAAQAALLAEEPFDGTAGTDVIGSTGGAGWGGPWALGADGILLNNFTFVSSGMTFTDVETSGLKTVFDPGNSTTRIIRPLAASITVDGSNPEAWASALVEIGSGAGDVNLGRGIGVELTNAGTPVVGFGKKLNSSFGVGLALSGTWVNSTVAANTVGVRFLALKLAFDGTDTVATVYVATDGDTINLADPTTFTGTATITIPGPLTFDGVNVYGYHGGTTSNGVDEIKVADTYGDFFEYSTANTPTPTNGAPAELVTTNLTWQAPDAYTALGYRVYFGTTEPNELEVAYGLTELTTGIENILTIDPVPGGDLGYETLYYWVVDTYEPNAPADPNLYPGPFWSFTTEPETPVITASPVSQTVVAGTEVTLSVSDQNGTGYAWSRTALDGTETGVGTDSNSLTLTAQEANEGDYVCVVSNFAGSDTSTAARLMTERMIGHWTFDNILTDEVTSVDAVVVDPNATDGVDAVWGYGVDANSIVGTGSLELSNTGDDPNVGGWLTIAGSANAYNFYPQGMTVSTWVKTPADQSGEYNDIVSKNYDDGASRWFHRVAGTNGLFRFGGAGATTSGTISDGGWHLMVTTYDPTTETIQVYLDGTPRGSTVTTPTAEGNLADLTIGGSALLANGWVNTAWAWNGFIDDVKIYTYARTAEQVADAYQAVVPGAQCLYPDFAGVYYDVAGGPLDGEGDPTPDCQITLADFAEFAKIWLSTGLYTSP